MIRGKLIHHNILTKIRAWDWAVLKALCETSYDSDLGKPMGKSITVFWRSCKQAIKVFKDIYLCNFCNT